MQSQGFITGNWKITEKEERKATLLISGEEYQIDNVVANVCSRDDADKLCIFVKTDYKGAEPVIIFNKETPRKYWAVEKSPYGVYRILHKELAYEKFDEFIRFLLNEYKIKVELFKAACQMINDSSEE